RVAFLICPVFFFFANEVVTNFLFRPKTLLELFFDWQVQKLAHLLEHFIGGFQKLRIGRCGNLWGRNCLGRQRGLRRGGALCSRQSSDWKHEKHKGKLLNFPPPESSPTRGSETW